MRTDSLRLQRHAIRLREYDDMWVWVYVITIYAQGEVTLFGEVAGGEVHWNAFGRIAALCWMTLPEHFRFLELDAWTLLPNRLHGIIVIREGRGDAYPKYDEPPYRRHYADAAPPLYEVIRSFKSKSTRRINTERGTPRSAVWEPGYSEHIIGNKDSFYYFRKYIVNEPAQ